MALLRTGPLRQYDELYMACQRSSRRSALRPMRNGFRYYFDRRDHEIGALR
jgi:hypothetical protein